MKILIKGGVWKNTEDEILKAAVMKYGKNQWARVASLLSRKSAKQCKARWYEWLDPSIKKIDWSREEEEKLLHLAKLMPNQWRTIAPIVGRTAGQCMEHYERLLDQAQEAAEGVVSDDPRRLRPGEIDPAPETKPARPDPIDMDDDEKEMLAEARARLANTKGKKQKRKARERQLEDSRRLSSLQKRRELKAAGIESRIGSGGKRKYIDYVKEIPFQKVPPVGFYDVGDEIRAAKSVKLDPAAHGLELSKMEGRHEKQEEERERAKDAKRLKSLFKANAPQAVMLLSAQNDPTTLRKRTALALPAPQVTDDQLEEIVKSGQASMMLPPDIFPSRPGAAGNASAALIGDYSAQFKGSLPTPLRTPIQENIVLQEARNARVLRDMTPFTGEELPELEEGSGFEGATPRAFKLATPNTVLATPGRGSGVGATPMLNTPGSVTSSFAGVGSEAGARVARDHLGLNDSTIGSSGSGSDFGSVSSLRTGKFRERELRHQVSNQLKSLPEPEFVYELSIPELGGADGDDGDDKDESYREDAADVAAKLEEERAKQVQLELARRSSVLKRGLPRPLSLTNQCLSFLSTGRTLEESRASSLSDQELQADKLINAEMVKILVNDEIMHPNPAPEAAKAQSRRGYNLAPPSLDDVEDDYLAHARNLVSQEFAEWQDASRQIDGASTDNVEAFTSAWEEAHKKIMYLPTKGLDGRGGFGVPENKQEILSSLTAQFSALRARMEKDSKRSSKVEAKLAITAKGYLARAQKLDEMLNNQFALYAKACTDLLCYRQFQANESKALASRIARAKSEMLSAESQEADWQRKYAELTKIQA